MNLQTAGRQMRHGFIALVATALWTMVVPLPPHASAAPVTYYSLPGSANQWIDGVTVGADGTLWVVQSIDGAPGASEQHSRILHLEPTGEVLASTPAEDGTPSAVMIVPAADGGVWETSLTHRLRHISASGETEEIALPAGFSFPGTLVSGHDGRAWTIRCEFTPGEHHGESCSAVAASLGGAVQEVKLPGISLQWPEGATIGSWSLGTVATSEGVWFWRSWAFNGAAPNMSTEFVSYGGLASSVVLPGNSRLVAPASGGSVWWIADEGEEGATIGQVSPAGMTSHLHHVGNVSESDPPDHFVGGPGRNGNLVWAQNATWSDTFDGQIGVARADGSTTDYKVEKDATDVPTNIPNVWSGTCTFGVRLYEAVDSSLWTISGGHPSRVTRQQPSGAFETFLLGGKGSEFAGETETGVWGMVEADPRSLYFSLNTAEGPKLARLDPLDPPPAEPRFPGHYAVETVEGSPPARRINLFLRSLIGQIRKALDRLERGGTKAHIRARFPMQGTASVYVRGADRPKVALLSAIATGPSGIHRVRLRLRRSGLALLHNKRRDPGTVTVMFRPDGGIRARRSAKVGL